MSAIKKIDVPKQENIIASVEEEIYDVAGIIGKDAKTVEEFSKKVEKFTTNIKEEVTKVEDIVHEVKESLDLIEGSINNVEGSISESSQVRIGSIVSNKTSPLQQRWTLLKTLTFGASFFFTIFQNRGTIKSSFTDFKNQANEASSRPTTYKLFSLFLVNVGPLAIGLKFIRNFMKSEKKLISTFERKLGTIDEMAEEVKKTLDVVDDVAHVVEHASEEVEKKANMIQEVISHEKSRPN